jgi:DNA primase
VSRYTADSRDRVFEAVDMLALVGTKVELRRAGVNSYFGLCPFHSERSGSFHVRPDEKHYHCFGCQASGDPFTFVRETEGLDFKGAMESLAGRFGVTLETEDEDPAAASRRQRRDRLFKLLERATQYYARYLWEAREAGDARAYLLGRGLNEDTLREFRVGFAPTAWDRIVIASRTAGYDDEELVAVGLAQRSRNRPGTVIDRFRERIMFPAVDARGRVHGFGARRMREDQFGAKYLNTSEGELYHKREVLFGIDLARAAGAKAGRMILVEGYTDVLALHQAGIVNAVGIMGTSLTEEQLAELERVVPVLELCLDADGAGQDAMMRAARAAAGRSLELRVVELPEGTDPADLVGTEGADGLRARVQSSVPFVVFNVNRILATSDTGSAEGRDEALIALAPVLGPLAPSVLRDKLIRTVSNRLELSDGTLNTMLADAARMSQDLGERPVLAQSVVGRTPAGNGGGAVPARTGERSAVSQPVRREQLFLALCVALPESGEATLTAVDVDELLTSEALRAAARQLTGRLRAPLSDLPADDEGLARTVAGIVERAGRVPDPTPERLRYARLVLEQTQLERAIIRARSAGSGVSELAARREVVREEMHAVEIEGPL